MPIIERTWPHPHVTADLATLRRVRPLTHLLTNSPARNFVVNAALAAGALPATICAESEVAAFVRVARAVLINLGGVTETLAEAIRTAVAAATAAGTPWVLDPTAVGALPFRTGLARELLTRHPAIIKGNASEILTLAGLAGGGQGADTTADVAEAVGPAVALARHTGAVVVVTGRIDTITDAEHVIAVPGGHPLMALVTGTGCALGGMMTALLGATGDPLRAAVAGSAAFAVAGEQAAQGAAGPGSFAAAFLDQLYTLGRAEAEAS